MIGWSTVDDHNNGDCNSFCPVCEIEDAQEEAERIYGMCTACGAVEVALVKAIGTRDLSAIGEHHAYPTGHGCEMCA